jgi:RNA polymerase sigma-70 factor (ECF subfamily)
VLFIGFLPFGFARATGPLRPVDRGAAARGYIALAQSPREVRSLQVLFRVCRLPSCNRTARGGDMTGRPDSAPDGTAARFEAELAPLWLRAQRGDEAAYRRALTCVAARLRAYFRRRTQSRPDDLEDLVQETLLALHLQRGTWDESIPVSAWVHAIARHKLVDLWRRQGRREALIESIDDIDDAAWPEAAEDAAPARRDLAKLLQCLPEAQRRAIELTKLEGLSVAEACVRTGASESAIKVQVHRGLKKLAALVRGEAERAGRALPPQAQADEA